MTLLSWGKKPPEDTEGGYQDTSLDDAERDILRRRDEEVEEDYDLDTTVFSDQGGNFYLQNRRKIYFEKREKQLYLSRWKKLREVFKNITGEGIQKTDNHHLFQKSDTEIETSRHEVLIYDGKKVYYKRKGAKKWELYSK